MNIYFTGGCSTTAFLCGRNWQIADTYNYPGKSVLLIDIYTLAVPDFGSTKEETVALQKTNIKTQKHERNNFTLCALR